MISRIFRPIKEGFFGVLRHGAMSFSSMVAVTLTLIIISLFMVFSLNVQSFTKELETSVQISVMIDYETTQEEIDQLSLDISNLEGVKNVTFSSKQDELNYYLESFEDEKTKEAFAPFLNDNPMHDAFYVKVTDGSMLEKVAKAIQPMEHVDQVNFGGQSAVGVVNILASIRYGGALMALALSILAIFLIQNTIKVTIMARADEIAIMRNVGATNNFIRAPFMFEGIIIGILGALLPIGLTYYGYQYLYRVTGGFVMTRMFVLFQPHPYLTYICLGLLAIGILVGFIGSFFSVSKYLRWKR